MGNILIMHGGAPTQVINASLYGVIKKARSLKIKDKILASELGTGGLIEKRIIDLTDISDADMERLRTSPGSAIGTSRDHLECEDYEKILCIAEELRADKILITGGNGTMDTARKLAELSKGTRLKVAGIPKTMDNDLSGTDHAPGYGSAARYISTSVRDVAMDVTGLPIHVVVIETFGRDAGWVTASSALAGCESETIPDMILLPEIPFDEERFLERIEKLQRNKNGLIVVASEGLKGKDGSPIVKPVFSSGRSIYFGEVAYYLASLIISRLGIKARSEKPGILSRSSSCLTSSVDRAEAVLFGERALEAILDGESGVMSSVQRESDNPYKVSFNSVKIDETVLKEKTMPRDFISEDGFGVTEKFISYLKPLVGDPLTEYFTLRRKNG